MAHGTLLICALLTVALGASSVAAQSCPYYTCSSCITHSYCGWTGYSCASGNSNGPYYTTTSTWYYTSCYSYITPGWDTGSYYVSYSFWSVSSWGLWLCVAGFILFWGAVCSCCFYRRRRVFVATTMAQPMNPGYVVGVPQTTYATAMYGQPMQQVSPYGQPMQQVSPYGQPAPQQPVCQPAPTPQPTGGIYGA